MDLKSQILDYIKTNRKGRINAVTGKQLSIRFGKSIRMVQESIESLRQDGEPILSSNQPPFGYFWPESPQEAEDCYRQMRNRAAHTFQTLGNIKLAIEKQFSTQLELEELKGVSGL